MQLDIRISDFRFEVNLNGERLIGDATPSEDGGYYICLSKHGKQTGIMTQGEDLMELRNNLVDAIKAYKDAEAKEEGEMSVEVAADVMKEWLDDYEDVLRDDLKWAVSIAIDYMKNK